MKTEQALVAVGGKASRLRLGTDQEPFAKSYMEADLCPLLHWCLRSLQYAGVKHVVLAGDRQEHLIAAEAVVDELLTPFDTVQFFQDEGVECMDSPIRLGTYSMIHISLNAAMPRTCQAII